MSGPVKRGRVHSFVLFVPSGVAPPALPWDNELSPDNPKVPRWIRLDRDCHGDGKVMPRELYALVVDGREPNEVIDAFMHEMQMAQAGDEATLLVHRDLHDDVEVYTRNGAPQLLAAVRGSEKPLGLLGSIPVNEERALRELVDRKLKVPR